MIIKRRNKNYLKNNDINLRVNTYTNNIIT